jgi:sirohydrochlorin cobaltochelatase
LNQPESSQISSVPPAASPMIPRSVLIVHGSSDSRYERAIARLQHRLNQQASDGQGIPILRLENRSKSLEQQLEHLFLQDPQAVWRVFPLFLLEGVHVREDVPAALRAVLQAHPQLHVSLVPPLGTTLLFGHWLQLWLAQQPTETWLLVTHGSRHPQAQAALQQCAQQVRAPLVSWTQPQILEQMLTDLGRTSHQGIRVLPLFLFPGALPANLGRRLCQWHWQHPEVPLRLAPVLCGLPGFDKLLDQWVALAWETPLAVLTLEGCTRD